ncbi:MAG TPA: DUF1353 domain-containing protein [Burkholderiales bacterium]|nr:DUF1353 domain-containing protein [Burkholderiales bacterium]
MTKRWLVAAALAMVTSAHAAEGGRFEGKIAVEWLDDPFVPSMRLIESFAYTEAAGKRWSAPRGQLLDGKGLPPLFRTLIGQPFEAGFRKSMVVYDAAVHQMAEPWDAAQRMFYEASLAEGVFPADAKAMYAVLAAQGSRWEVKGSHCFGSCHGSTVPLEWRPVVDEGKVSELVAWVRATDPTIEEIDKRAKTTVKAQGPHIFEQPPCEGMYSGSTRVRNKCIVTNASESSSR